MVVMEISSVSWTADLHEHWKKIHLILGIFACPFPVAGCAFVSLFVDLPFAKDENSQKEAKNKATLTSIDLDMWRQRNINLYQLEKKTCLREKQFYSQSSTQFKWQTISDKYEDE